MIFKKILLHRKEPEICSICEQGILNKNFFSKNKKLSKRSF